MLALCKYYYGLYAAHETRRAYLNLGLRVRIGFYLEISSRVLVLRHAGNSCENIAHPNKADPGKWVGGWRSTLSPCTTTERNVPRSHISGGVLLCFCKTRFCIHSNRKFTSGRSQRQMVGWTATVEMGATPGAAIFSPPPLRWQSPRLPARARPCQTSPSFCSDPC